MPLMLFSQEKKPASLPVLPNCHECGAKATCAYPAQTNPRQQADVVFVVNRPAGDYDLALADALNYSDLTRYCARVGFSLASAAVLPAAACFSAKEEAWKHCSPLLASEIRRLKPKLVVPVGPDPTSSVISTFWNAPAELQDRWYGYAIPERSLNAWICPVGLANPGSRNTIASNTWLFRWLRNAKDHNYRPWGPDSVDPLQCVKIIENSDEVFDVLARASKASLVAFDYETTGLKPEWSCHRVYSLGLSWVEGDEVVGYAFMVLPKHHDAIRAFLTSPARKIAANMKFEDRWSRQIFRVSVTNWQWDTMLASHWENPAPATKGHKLMAFARLGVPYYASAIEGFFDAKKNSQPNNIFHAPIRPLLTYNAMDAVTELLLASIQMVENGIIAKHFVPAKYLPRGKHEAD